MKLPFHLVLDYAHRFPQEVEAAMQIFFANQPPKSEAQEQEAFPLFSEWLIYNYLLPNGDTFLVDYCRRNPDDLETGVLDSLIEISKTQIYGAFEIVEVNRRGWVVLYHFLTGLKFKIHDRLSTPTLPTHGTLVARIGKIKNLWYFVGANPIYLSITYSRRMKQFLKGNAGFHPSPKETCELLAAEKAKLPPKLSPLEIKARQEKIKQEYEKLKTEFDLRLTFDEILTRIFLEDGAHPSQFFKRLIRRDVPENVYFERFEIFQDLWNLFPHQILKGKSPVEMIEEFRTDFPTADPKTP